jgi:hypothetical protein
MAQDNSKNTLSVRQAANERGCSLKAILDLLYAGRLPGAQKIARRWNIPRVALEAYDKRLRGEQQRQASADTLPSRQGRDGS